MFTISAERIWTSQGWIENASIHINNGVIQRITNNENDSCEVPILTPGMLELHVHGSYGFSVENCEEEEMRKWLCRLVTHGVTGVLVTPSTAPVDVMSKTVALTAKIMKNQNLSEARILGVHLEGPFINPIRKGGMDPRYILLPTISNYRKISGDNEQIVRLVTLAPEMPNADELISYLHDKEVCVSAGHSDATFDEMNHAIEFGVDGITHFFNATRPIHHRDPGLLTAAILAPNAICEAIGDLVHLKPEIIRLLIQAVGVSRIALITDAVPLTGMPDGVYEDNLIVKNGSPQKLDGTLSGGKMMMDEIVRAMIYSARLDPWDVLCMACHSPAKRINNNKIGDICPNFSANLVALDENYHVMFSVVNGEKVYKKEE